MREYLPVALAFVSALLIYLGSPGQQWRATPLWPHFSRKLALASALIAPFTGTHTTHPATAFFIVITTLMACLVTFPFLAAFRRGNPASESQR